MKIILSNSRRDALKNFTNRFTHKFLHFYRLCATVALPILIKSKDCPINKESSVHLKEFSNVIHIDSKGLCNVIPTDPHRVYISDPMRLTPKDEVVSVSDEIKPN